MKKYYIYIGIAIFIVALYFFYKTYKEKQIKKALLADNQPTSLAQEVGDFIKETVSTSNGNPAKDNIPPLKKGSRGKYVKQLQEALITRYKVKLPKNGADGVWGTETENALISLKMPTVIYWSHWSAITGIPIKTDGKNVQFYPAKQIKGLKNPVNDKFYRAY